MKKVRIVNTSGIGYATKVIDVETGEEIPGIQRIELVLDAQDATKCILHLVQVETDMVVPVSQIVTTHLIPKLGEGEPLSITAFTDAALHETTELGIPVPGWKTYQPVKGSYVTIEDVKQDED